MTSYHHISSVPVHHLASSSAVIVQGIMLALAHPVQHSSVDCTHRPSSSSSSRTSRPHPRKSTSFVVSTNHTPSSSSSSVTSSSSGRSSAREGQSSPRHASSQSVQSAQSNQQDLLHSRDNNPPIPPPSRRNSSDSSTPGRVESEAFNIHTYDPHQLLRLLASLLTQIATTNDNLTRRDTFSSASFQRTNVHLTDHPPIWRTLTTASREALSSTSSLTFHARNIPSISLEAYLVRILKYCPASNEVFLSLLVYFDRMSKLAKEANGKLFVIDSYNIHRLVIAGVTVASKFFSDVFYTNSRYAKVGNQSLAL